MNLSEAEIQILASLRRLEIEEQPPSKTTLEQAGERYWLFREDWTSAFDELLKKALIQGDEHGYILTDLGQPWAELYFAERPDHFWYYYQQFYPRAHASQAHSRLCQLVFGADHCQEGQVDMVSFNDLLNFLNINPGDKLLDLGCGAGGLAEYASDRTGAEVTGIDNSATAIETANVRTLAKRDRMTFLKADMNTMELPTCSFDAAISLDTLYWVVDVKAALSSIVQLLKPGGRLGVFIAVTLEDCEDVTELEPHGTWLASALAELDLSYVVHNYTERFQNFWPSMKVAVEALHDDFVAEGNEFICQALLKDALDEYIPAGEANELRRYLYIVSIS